MNHNCDDRSVWKQLQHWWLDYEWFVVAVLAVLSFSLGCIGFRMYFVTLQAPWTVPDVIYKSLQLFAWKCDVAAPLPTTLSIARFFSLFVATYAALKALGAILREQLQRKRLSRLRGHVIVCGVGRIGPRLVRDFLRTDEHVVIIEQEEANEKVGACRDLGAIPVFGNATEMSILLKAGVHRAATLVAVTGDDATNVQIATRAHQLVHKCRPASGGKLQCYIHIVGVRLFNRFRQHHVLGDTQDALVIHSFNSYLDSVRVLFNQHPLDYVRIAPDDKRTVHLIILGFGTMGESVMLQAAKIAHYANGMKLRVTVFDYDAPKREAQLRQQYAQLDEVCQATFVPGDIREAASVKQVVDLAMTGGTIPTVVACLPNDIDNISFAMDALDLLKENQTPILVRITQERGWDSLFDADCSASKLAGRVHAFGMISATFTRDIILGEEAQKLAKATHEDYVAQRRKEGQPDTAPNMKPWHEVDEMFRESSRQQADHIPVKLRAVGCISSDDTGRTAAVFSKDEIQLLSKMEHARWNAERFLDNWKFVRLEDSPQKMKKESPYLVDWDCLPVNIKKYDSDAVCNIPNLLSMIHQKVYRKEV